MPTFLIIAGAGTLVLALLLVSPLVFGGTRARGRDAADAAVYRDQLTELDREISRGTIGTAEAEGARAEIARRLIAATRRAEGGAVLSPAPARVSRLAALVTLVATPALAGLLYFAIGTPGAPDQPLAGRSDTDRAGMPSQEEAERLAADRRPAPPVLDPEYVALVERLEKVVASRPLEIEGHRLLARSLARSGRWVDARKAYDKLLGILGASATPDDHANRAEAMIHAAGGYVSPQAMAALEAALKADPAQITARYYAGFALRQSRRTEEAAAMWEGLLKDDRASAQPRGAEWQATLAALIAETRGRAAPGPSREEVEAAGEMTEEDRTAMIAGMVARLEERLTEQGGEAEEWVRLINAYMQLGKTDDAERIFALSQEKIGEPTARAFVRERALVMGLELE